MSQVREYTSSQLTGGIPISPVDETEFLGLQFQLEGGSGSTCSVDVTLDDITFM